MIIGPSNRNFHIIHKINHSFSNKQSNEHIKSYKMDDTIQISSLAKKTMKINEYIKYANSLPNIREDKIQEAKINLRKYIQTDGSISPEILDNIVEKITNQIL